MTDEEMKPMIVLNEAERTIVSCLYSINLPAFPETTPRLPFSLTPKLWRRWQLRSENLEKIYEALCRSPDRKSPAYSRAARKALKCFFEAKKARSEEADFQEVCAHYYRLGCAVAGLCASVKASTPGIKNKGRKHPLEDDAKKAWEQLRKKGNANPGVAEIIDLMNRLPSLGKKRARGDSVELDARTVANEVSQWRTKWWFESLLHG
ncbi:MAG TPA: hypothetical protein VKC60_03915 [Opitutaceae bacterium]|nr:hypothetical protein [Opitutaceae bacterium]